MHHRAARPAAALLAAALALGAAGCGDAETSGGATTPAAATDTAATGGAYRELVETSRGLLDAPVRAVALPEELVSTVGTVGVSPDVVPDGGVAPVLSTADLDPAAPDPAAPGEFAGGCDAAVALAGADLLRRVPMAAPDGTRTVPLALTEDGSVLATRTAPAPEGALLPEDPYALVVLGTDGAEATLPAPAPLPSGDPTGPGQPDGAEGRVPMQAVRASTQDGRAVWVQAPDTDLYTLTWQLAVADPGGGGSRVVADAQDLLGVDGPIPAFSQWNTPVLAGEVAYQAAVIPAADGPWTWDTDGSRWTGGLVAAPLAPGASDAGPRVLTAGTRLVAGDGTDVIHLVDGTLVENRPGDGTEDGTSRRFAIVAQGLDADPVAWVTGEVPAGSAVTALALSPELLVWVVSHYADETATLLALDRESGVVRAVELGDLLAAPSVAGRRVGWGNWSGNGDPGEYLWEIPAPASPAGPQALVDEEAAGLVRLGENRGGSRVRVAGEGGEFVAVTGTVGDPATGPSALWSAGGSPAAAGDAPDGTLAEYVLRLP